MRRRQFLQAGLAAPAAGSLMRQNQADEPMSEGLASSGPS